jgi:hypothetical protein
MADVTFGLTDQVEGAELPGDTRSSRRTLDEYIDVR